MIQELSVLAIYLPSKKAKISLIVHTNLLLIYVPIVLRRFYRITSVMQFIHTLHIALWILQLYCKKLICS